MKHLLLCCSLLFALTGATGPLSLHADLKRASLDLLDPVGITIVVINSGKQPVTAHFPTADTYDIAIASGGKEVWRWSAVHASAQVLRSFIFAPGKTTLVVHYWDELADGRSLAAGNYIARITLVDGKYRPFVELPIRFAIPLPIAAARKLPLNSAATISGTLRSKGTLMELADSSGTIGLSKRISMQDPTGAFVVRGYLVKENNELLFTVDRWARAFNNVAITGIPDWLQGDFGGQHSALHLAATEGSLQFDCAHATVNSLRAADDTHATA
ncbi:MAG: BsuPI-related putative proteinase inhibitor, partial [Candidatus Eremiobacteraeota bacterium]|nr:BsuPI-related putative proteinase inhibitor [Candidatus Eremiobacteraeota bacterium]